MEYKKGRGRDALKKHVSIENKQHKNVLQSRATAERPMSWSKDSQKHDLSIQLTRRIFQILIEDLSPS